MFPPHLDFRHLRAIVSIERVLSARGLLRSMRREGTRLVGPCPIHQGHGRFSFVVDPVENRWYCFSGCSTGGDVVELVRRMDRVGYREAAETLAEVARLSPSPAPSPLPARPPRDPSPFQPFTRRLELDPHVPFLAKKGIAPATARFFEAGAWKGRGFLQDCIGVRLHDVQGYPLGYAGRRLNVDEADRLGKWKVPPRFPKRSTLYNAHRVASDLDGGTVVIVEGPWEVMRLHQLGLPSVALLGTHLSDAQRAILSRAGRILLLLDADAAGIVASRRIASEIANHGPVVDEVRLGDGLDPDDLSDEDLRAALRPAFFLTGLALHAGGAPRPSSAERPPGAGT